MGEVQWDGLLFVSYSFFLSFLRRIVPLRAPPNTGRVAHVGKGSQIVAKTLKTSSSVVRGKLTRIGDFPDNHMNNPDSFP